MIDDGTEYRTQSIINAAFLLSCGHEPLGVTRNDKGMLVLRFNRSIVDSDLSRFQNAKTRVERAFKGQ